MKGYVAGVLVTFGFFLIFQGVRIVRMVTPDFDREDDAS